MGDFLLGIQREKMAFGPVFFVSRAVVRGSEILRRVPQQIWCQKNATFSSCPSWYIYTQSLTLAGAGLIASKDVGLFEAFSCPWPPSPTFYKLLEIERPTLYPTAFRSPQLELIELDDEQRRKCQRRPLRTYSRR